jgi:hypothetical protein
LIRQNRQRRDMSTETIIPFPVARNRQFVGSLGAFDWPL